MMAFDLDSYVAAFNAGDDEAVVNEFFTEDMVLDGPDRTLHGRQPWIDLLKFMHHGIREKLTPLAIARNGEILLAEMQVEFTATLDRPDFMYGPLLKGDTMQLRFFASYRLRGDLIARLALAWWPPVPAS
jgi:hypothetical protein